YVAFEGAVRTMQTTAETNKKLLVKYGLSEPVLVELGALLDRFAKARELCDQGRVVHKAATQQLEELAKELGSVIRTMDARNRIRYKDDTQLLEQWIAASTVLGNPLPVELGQPVEPVPSPDAGQPSSGTQGSTQGGTPAAGGEVRPAA